MREFTEFEKELIRRIGSRKGNNLPKLIEPYLLDVKISVNIETNVSKIIFDTDYNEQIDKTPHRIAKIEEIIIQSVNLIKLFEDKGYIFTYTSANQIQNPFTYGDANISPSSISYSFPDQRISELLTRYSIQEIFITPEIAVFIKNGFIPRDEKRFRKQFLLAITALIVAISGVFTNLYFNIKKEFFSVGQKIENTQFKILLNHLDARKSVNANHKESLINNNKALDTLHEK